MNNIEDNIILIIPNTIKNNIIKKVRENNKILNIKFITINEFTKNYYFDYDNKALYYLMKKYNYKYNVAKVYLKNLYYIKDDINYSSEKLIKLKNIKTELINNNLLKFNNLFKNYIKNKKIVVYGFDSLNKLERQMFKELNNIKILPNEKGPYEHSKVYEFNTLENEVDFLCVKIIELINKGVDPNKIKLLNVTSEYYNTIDRLFKFYNLPITPLFKTNLYSTKIGNFFINNLNKDINITLQLLKTNFDLNKEENINIYNKLINIINEYTWQDNYLEIKELIINDLKNTYITEKTLKTTIELLNINNNIFEDDNYYFLLNFNGGSIPNITKDEDYITDNLKKDTLIDTTTYINKQQRKNIITILSRIKNLTITYKLRSLNGEYNISNLNEDLSLKIITNYKDQYNYSNIYNKLKLSMKLDDMIKYNVQDDDISILYHNYKDIQYLKYDNKFTGLNKSHVLKYLNNELKLSYSTIDNFNRCGFRYYIGNILGLSIYEDTFMTFLGTLYHYILSIAFTNNIDIDKEYEHQIKLSNRNFTIKEKFFLNKLKDELKFIIENIKIQLENSSLDKSLYEENIVIDKSKDNNIKIIFKGIVDKIMYKETPSKTITAIIDYKTGNPKIDLNTSIYGIEMQLPIYLYLVSNTPKLKNVEFAGFYLQKVLNNEIIKDNKTSYIDLKRKNLKLQGYSNEDTNILSLFDQNYQDSQMIKSMKTTKTGFYSYAKVLSNDMITNLINTVDNSINQSIEKILNCEFDINPKKIGDENYGCSFCKFKDICFKKNNDIVTLKEYKYEKFLKENIESEM